MSEQVHLGVDLGAESGRVMAGHWNGRQLRLEELHRFPNSAIELTGTLRWDVLRLWAEIQHGLGAAAKRFGKTIVSVGVDTWGVDYVLMSRSGELLGLPYCYRDARTRGLVKEACRRVPRAEIFAQSGLQFMDINTLCQWLAHHRSHPEIFAAADKFLMIPDFLNRCLCGAQAVEFTNATTTQFLHPATRTWSVDLLRRLDLPTHLLPEIVPPGTTLGELRESVTTQTGLSRIAVIAPATHDTGSAVAAVPTESTGATNWAYISSGTWSLMGVETREPILGARALELNVTNEGGVDGTWRVLKNVMGLWLVQQCRRAFAARGGPQDYAELTRLAGAAPSLCSLINPDDPRFLNPADMPGEIQAFCRETGQVIPESEGALVRCALESLALKYAVVLGQLEELTGSRIDITHVVGGGSNNALLNQLTADACERRVVAGPVEATVMGNLLMQARARGEIASLAELRAVVRNSSERTEFSPRNERGGWQEARRRFGELI